MHFEGELVAGTESELTLTVSRDGQPVMDLEPYLGALGHLVAIREGDLAYLHVHPLDETEGAGGPEVRFAVEVPTAVVATRCSSTSRTVASSGPLRCWRRRTPEADPG